MAQIRERRADIHFPDDFLWGVSGASYQMEGAVHEGGRGESIWDRFSHIPGRIANDDNADVAVDFYHRYEEDIRLIKELEIPAFRFSIAWPRIFPHDEAHVNEEGLQFYRRVLEELKHRGIRAVATLYHWDLPQWAQDRGGWANPEIIKWYAAYAYTVMSCLDGLVDCWITFNEPWVAVFEGYYTGNFAPGIRDFSMAVKCAHLMLLAHGMVVSRFRREGLSGKIGITLNLCPKEPETQSEQDRAASDIRDGYMNRWFLDPLFKGSYPADMIDYYRRQGVAVPEMTREEAHLIAVPVDFLGVNYYNIDFTRASSTGWPVYFEQGKTSWPKTVYDWPITEWGLKDILIRLKEEYAPAAIYVTENGMSALDYVSLDGQVHDPYRIDYLDRHIGACHDAISKGVPLKGYFVWSLHDNFEWNTGYRNQFGLIHVDRLTLERTIKDSGYWYRDVIRENGITVRE